MKKVQSIGNQTYQTIYLSTMVQLYICIVDFIKEKLVQSLSCLGILK